MRTASSITTAIGFASMSFVPIKAIAQSGVYDSFGILMAFVMSFTLLMSLLSMNRKEMAGIAFVLVGAGAVLHGTPLRTRVRTHIVLTRGHERKSRLTNLWWRSELLSVCFS